MWLQILHTCSCIFFVRLNTTINTSAQINFVWLHTIFLVTDLFFLIEVFTLAIIFLSVILFLLFINRIQKHEYEFRFLLLPWVTETFTFLLFYTRILTCSCGVLSVFFINQFHLAGVSAFIEKSKYIFFIIITIYKNSIYIKYDDWIIMKAKQ